MTIDKENYGEIAEALHCWLTLNHAGQWSNEYEYLCKSPFKPGPMWSESKVENENEFYLLITQENYKQLMDELLAFIDL